MRTIFSNKKSGCERDDLRGGIAMFINEWQGSDQKLYIEYGNSESGCNKVHSSRMIEIGKWTHVAVAVQESRIALYIDGSRDTDDALPSPHR